jgi:acyl dehydratase
MTTGMIEGAFTATMEDPDDPAMFERNRIHTTEGAKEYGFKGAFVGGVTLYAWCVPTIVEALGDAWLDEGWVNLRFRRPVYPGTQIQVQVTPQDNAPPDNTAPDNTAPDNTGAHRFEAVNDAEHEAAIVGEVGLGHAPWLGELRETPFSPPVARAEGSERPYLTLADAPVGQPLRSYRYGRHTPPPPGATGPMAEITALDSPGGPVLHPAVLARQMISFLAWSYEYGHPAIHVSSHIQHFARIPADQDVVLCGTLVDAYERNGHHQAVTDADLYSLDGQRLARLRHVNIFKVRKASGA